jgi:hypothetical protein
MSRVIIYQPGGVGDVTMTTPALRQFAKENPNTEVFLAINNRVANSHIADNYPYVHEIVPVRCAWQDFGNNFQLGCKEVRMDLNAFARRNRVDEILEIKLPISQHKIVQYHHELGVRLTSDRMDIFMPDGIQDRVQEWIDENGVNEPFALIHPHANLALKDIPPDLVQQYIQSCRIHSVIIDKHFVDPDIHFSFELLRRAHRVFLCESAFITAADVFEKQNVLILAWQKDTFKFVEPRHITPKVMYKS